MEAAEQERLTRVGPGSPMGGLLRRYWFPLTASSRVAAPGSLHALRLLGEDLLLCRDHSGRLGLLEAHCPHRRVALRFGCLDDEGLRCPYHGWKFALDGRCLEMPAEPPDTPLRTRVRLGSYAVQELGGLVWGYLGPEPAPELPHYDLLTKPGVLRDIGWAELPCNWLQIMENSVDPYHTEWLHGHHLSQYGQGPAAYRRRTVQVGFERFRYGIIKRRLLEGGSEQDDGWRVGHPLVFPCTLRVGEGFRQRFQFRVPRDDRSTLHLWYSTYRLPPGMEAPPQPVVPEYEVPWRDADGDLRVDFIDAGDIMAWVSPGAISDRTKEQLASSDRGLVMYRRLLLEQLAAVEAGCDPLGVIRDPDEARNLELPHEIEKLGGGDDFVLRAMGGGHGRFSPLYDTVVNAWQQAV